MRTRPVTTDPNAAALVHGPGTPRPLIFEQLVWSTASRNLLDSGFGPMAQSSGWPSYERSDRSGGLGGLVRFLPDGASSHILRGTVAPRCLALAHTRLGHVLLAKTHLGVDDGGRPNKYLVHALLDRSATATVYDLLTAAGSGALLSDLPLDFELTRSLPAVTLPAPEPPVGGWHPVDPVVRREWLRRCALGVLRWERTGAPLVLVSVDEDRARSMLVDVVAMLPARLVARLSVSTYEQDPQGSGFDLCIGIPPFVARAGTGAAAGVVDLDVSGPPAAPPQTIDETATTALVDLYLEGRTVHADVARLEELCAAESDRRLLTRPVGQLRREEVERLLQTGHAGAWLDLPGAVDRLLHEVVESHGALSPVVVRLAPVLSADTRHQLAEALSVRLTDAVTHPDRHREALVLLDLAEDLNLGNRIAEALWQYVDTELAEGRPTTLDLELALPLMRRADQLSPAPTPAVLARRVQLPGMDEVVAREWTSINDAVIVQHVLRPGADLIGAFGWLLEHHPRQWAAAIDNALARQEITPDRVLDVLPPLSGQLPSLVEGLCQCRHLPVGFVLQRALAHQDLPPQDVAFVTRAYWRQLARQAEIPEPAVTVIAQALAATSDERRWIRRLPFRHKQQPT
jgi:hypothetical protein